MPFYKFRNAETGEVYEELMGISACEEFLVKNPHITREFNGAPMLVGGLGDRLRPDAGFTDMMGRIARANPTSKLADEYGDKGIKASKIRDTVKKVQKKYGVNSST